VSSDAGEERRAMAAQAPERDTTPALGSRGGPARWRRALEGAAVALHRPGWLDARWSYLYGRDTGYATASDPPPGSVEDARQAPTRRPAARPRPGAGHEGAGVDLGGAGLFLDRRHRRRLVVRRTRLRPDGRSPLGADPRVSWRSARWARRRRC
jgi:hypothetical protein